MLAVIELLKCIGISFAILMLVRLNAKHEHR